MQWMKCWWIYIVYPIYLWLHFNDTDTELDGWCPPKSAVCGFHADNDIDTLNLLAERGRANYKVRGTGKRLHKVDQNRFREACRGGSCVFKVSCDQEYRKGTYWAMFDDRWLLRWCRWNRVLYRFGALKGTPNSRRPQLSHDILPC